MKGRLVFRLRRLALAAIAVMSIVALPTHAPAASPGFTVSGNTILDPTGATFTMRGSNILYDTSLDGFGANANDVTAMVNIWHLNTVRLLVSEDFWIGSEQTIDGAANPNYCPAYAGYQSHIDDWVGKATALHMLVLIDLHTNELNGVIPCTTTPDPQRWTMADEALAPTYWKQVATRYGGNPYVAFEPYNEPQCLTAQQWLHGGDVTTDSCHGGGVHYQAAGMQELYDVIRATGATNLVVVDGVKDKDTPLAAGKTDAAINPSGGYDVSYATSTPVVGFNVVYASHPYLGNDCGTMPPNIEQKVGIPSLSVPVVIDEFGSACTLNPKDDGDLAASKYAEVIAYAESHRLGWAAFGWGLHNCYWNDKGKWECNYGLLANLSTFAPSVPGRPVYEDAVARGTAGT
jgi:hypothetical protein